MMGFELARNRDRRQEYAQWGDQSNENRKSLSRLLPPGT
jgi:hypothetical protein